MALTLLAANNAQTVLAAGINASATTLTVNTGTGSLFPSAVSGSSFFKLTLIDAATGQLTEIMHVISRTGDAMTVTRAQEGTVARAWSANDIVANMMTAGTLSNFQPLDDTLTALASLVGSANKIAYFNGPETAALTDITSPGRDFIGKGSVADMLSYLGFQKGISGGLSWTKINGVTEIWGRASIPVGGMTLTLPTAMPDDAYTITATDADASIGQGAVIVGAQISTTQIHLHALKQGASGFLVDAAAGEVFFTVKSKVTV